MLDRDFVSNYLRNQSEKKRLDDDVISLSDSSDEEGEKSVEFVSEMKPPEISPRTERDQLRQQNKDLKHNLHKLKIHVEALQQHVINNGQPSVPNENVATGNILVENAPDDFNDIEPALDISFDSEWVLNEINDIQQNGNMSLLADQLVENLDNTE